MYSSHTHTQPDWQAVTERYREAVRTSHRLASWSDRSTAVTDKRSTNVSCHCYSLGHVLSLEDVVYSSRVTTGVEWTL